MQRHGLLQRAIVTTLPAMPRPLVSHFARQYVAGATLADAQRVIDRLEADGRLITIDVLGEDYRTPAEARALVDEYLRILEAPSRTSPTLSVMMTGLGLRIDPKLCWEHLLEVSAAARERGRLVTINMEDSGTTTETLDAYRRVRAEGHDHVGIVLQAALRRTRTDVAELAALAPRTRLVKGIWVEPYRVAYDDYDAIRRNYSLLLGDLIEAGSYVEIATHDELLVAEALDLIARHGLRPDRYEFQMLLGVKPELGGVLAGDGHKVRVYVPYGEHWYEYCIRRLKESPDVARHAIAAGLGDTLSRVRRRGAPAR